MPATETEYEHITFENGLFDEEVPVIAGTTMKVIEFVQEKTPTALRAASKP